MCTFWKQPLRWIKQNILANPDAAASITSGILTAIAFMLEDSQFSIAVAIYICSYIIGCYATTKEGLITLIRDKELDVNLLMFIAAVGAASIGFWFEGAVLIFIFSLSGALESYALARSEKDISALIQMNPDKARLYNQEDNTEEYVAISEIKVRDIVMIKPGEIIPVDAKIITGSSSINQSTITGESIPVDVTIGNEVFAGTLNGAGSLIVEVVRANTDTVFSKIISLLEESRNRVPKSQQGIEKIEKIYVKIVLVITAALIGASYLFMQDSFMDALYKAMVFLVVASPCALVASIMPPILAGISNAAKHGILFKNGEQIEILARTTTVAFDKTGTVTVGKPHVTDIIPLAHYPEEEVLQIAGSIESMSAHPIAQAIVSHALNREVALATPQKIEEKFGHGVTAEYRDKVWRLGKPLLFSEVLTPETADQVSRLESEGKTVVLLSFEDQDQPNTLAAIIALQDKVREESANVLQKINNLGLKTAMLTGDQPATASSIAQKLNIAQIHSSLLPEDKVNLILKMRENNEVVAMIGDGLNDAPALAHADTGIALGKAGNNITIESADIILMNDDLTKVNKALNIARKTARIIKQNICFSLSVITILIITNFVEGIALPFGVIYHEGSTFLVILNGLRILTYKA